MLSKVNTLHDESNLYDDASFIPKPLQNEYQVCTFHYFNDRNKRFINGILSMFYSYY